MSENATEPTATEQKSVQAYRHDARNALTRGREALSLQSLTRNEQTKEVYHLLNGAISSVLAGRQGLSQEAQVRHLDRALKRTTENREKAEAALAQAEQAIRDGLEAALVNWSENILGEVDDAIASLTEAKEFAQSRDFAAWQEAKGRPVGDLGPQFDNVPDESDVDDEDEE